MAAATCCWSGPAPSWCSLNIRSARSRVGTWTRLLWECSCPSGPTSAHRPDPAGWTVASSSPAPATTTTRVRHPDPGVPSLPPAPGGLQLYGWTAIDAQTSAPRSSSPTSARMSRYRSALSPTPNPKKAALLKEFHIATRSSQFQAGLLHSFSIPPLARGFPLLPGVWRNPLRDERLAALAPCPRSGGLFFAGRDRQAAAVTKLKIVSWNINSVRARTGTGRAPDRGAAARPVVPAGNQGASTASSRPTCSAGLATGTSSSTASGCTMASRSSAGSAARPRQARLAGQWRSAPRRRPPAVRNPARERLCPGRRRHPRPQAQPQVRPEARLHRAHDPLVGRSQRSRRSSSATSTSRRSNATCGATRPCSRSSAIRRSRSRR